MRTAASIVALLLAALVCATSGGSVPDVTVLEFALQMTGSCTSETESVLNCKIKGGTQQITTSISATDAVTFNVKKGVGTYAMLTFSIGSDGPLSANMTFGTHLARNHTLNLNPLPGMFRGPSEKQGCYIISGAYVVLGGAGAFQDAYGSIIYSHLFDTNNMNMTSFVYGRPFVLPVVQPAPVVPTLSAQLLP